MSRILNCDPVVPPGVPRETLVAWLKMIGDCDAHRKSQRGKLVIAQPGAQQTFESVLELWLRKYTEYSNGSALPVVSDFIFALLCNLSLNANPPTPSIESSRWHMILLTQHLRIWSCQHTVETFSTVPTTPENLEPMVVHFIVSQTAMLHIAPPQVDDVETVAATQTLRQLIRYPRPAPEVSTLDPSVASFLPPDAKEKEDDESEVNSSPGLFFSDSTELIAYDFIPLCVRVFGVVYLHRWLTNRFTVNRLGYPCQQDGAMQKIRAWFLRICSYEEDEKFQQTFSTLCYEHLLPLGARETAGRPIAGHRVRDFRYIGAYRILKEYLGSDTSGAIADMFDEKIETIASDSEHLLYDLLSLRMFSDLVFQYTGAKFLEEFYITPNRLSEHVDRIDQVHVFDQKRYPICTRLNRQWVVHWDGTWWVANSALHMGLQWIKIIHCEYSDRLLSLETVTRIHAMFYTNSNARE